MRESFPHFSERAAPSTREVATEKSSQDTSPSYGRWAEILVFDASWVRGLVPAACLLCLAFFVLGGVFFLSSRQELARGPVASGVSSMPPSSGGPTSASPNSAGIVTKEAVGDVDQEIAVVDATPALSLDIADKDEPTLSDRYSLDNLLIPVKGVEPQQLRNTYKDARSGGRVHNAIDIMAPRGTPVLAATSGQVAKVFLSRLGGKTLYIFDDSGDYVHYYAHLDGYSRKFEIGDRVLRGEKIATVGSTGNASDDAPHLHYAIYRIEEGEGWWQGDPLNPYPLLK